MLFFPSVFPPFLPLTFSYIYRLFLPLPPHSHTVPLFLPLPSTPPSSPHRSLCLHGLQESHWKVPWQSPRRTAAVTPSTPLPADQVDLGPSLVTARPVPPTLRTGRAMEGEREGGEEHLTEFTREEEGEGGEEGSCHLSSLRDEAPCQLAWWCRPSSCRMEGSDTCCELIQIRFSLICAVSDC